MTETGLFGLPNCVNILLNRLDTFSYVILASDLNYLNVHPHVKLLQTNVKPRFFDLRQRAEKVVSDSPGLVDFAIGLVIFVLNVPDGQVLFFGEIQITIQKTFLCTLFVSTF